MGSEITGTSALASAFTVICSLACAFGLIVAASTGVKWVITLYLGITAVGILLVVPNRALWLLFAFLFLLPIAIDMNPVLLDTSFPRSIRGLQISLWEVPFALLLLLWIYQVLAGKLRFHSAIPITIPFVLLIFMTTIGQIRAGTERQLIAFTFLSAMQSLFVFLVITSFTERKGFLKPAIVCLLLTIVPQFLVGTAQAATHSDLGFVAKTVETMDGSVFRVGGLFGVHNRLAAYLGIVLPLGVAIMFSPIANRLKYGFVLPVTAMGLFLEVLTFSRGGWISLTAGVSVTVVLCSWKMSKRVIFPGMVVLLALSIIGGGAFLSSSSIRDRILRSKQSATWSRIALYELSLRIIREHPLAGVGFDEFVPKGRAYDTNAARITYGFPLPVHNEYLLITSELGIPGLLSLLWILFVSMKYALCAGLSSNQSLYHYLAFGVFGGLLTWSIHANVMFNRVLVHAVFWILPALAYSLHKMLIKEGTAYASHQLSNRSLAVIAGAD